MNGTTLRTAAAVACVAALAAPGSALAANKTKRVKKAAPTVTVVVPHKYDAGGDGAGALTITSTTKLNLFDALGVATTLGNSALAQLGLPPVQLPPLP